MTPVDLHDYFEHELARFCASHYAGDEGIFAAMRYALAGSGKRVRPILSMLAAQTVGAPPDVARTSALALEMTHTYSLVHDDLPCMDDDKMRRGRPATHVVYGEAYALLVGDALLTDAFALLAAEPHAGRLVRELSQAAGGHGMVQGQALDLFWTGRTDSHRDILNTINRLKTGRLLGAACAMGAIAGGANDDHTTHFREFGRLIGHAFQICDDLLDDTKGTGKTRGKDKESGKLTYLALMGHDEAESAARELTKRAVEQLLPFGEAAESLRQFGLNLLTRRH